MAIESQYDSVSKTAAENSKTETAPSEDVEGNEAAVESKQVSEEDTKEQQQEVPEAENSDPVKQEGEQLSLFNEKDFGEQTEEAPATEEAPVEEAPTEEASTEEAPSEEAPATEEEAPSQDDIYSTDNEVDTDKGFDLADRERVGDGVNQISIAAASAFNKALKGFKRVFQKSELRFM